MYFYLKKTTKFTHNKLKACNILFCWAKKKCETENIKVSLRVVLVFLASGLKGKILSLFPFVSFWGFFKMFIVYLISSSKL